MSFNKYFKDELTAIHELGKVFAERNPRLAPFLAVEGQDPDVERLMEGFAFLTGRLKQKLDDELPELTHSLMSLMWPHFLRPIPSMAILQFEPLPSLSGNQVIVKGTELQSQKVDGTSCRFQTCYDMDILPLEIKAVEHYKKPMSTMVSIHLKTTTNVSWADLALDKLRIYLHGAVHTAQLLFLSLFRDLVQVDVVANGKNSEEILINRLDKSCIRAAGFDKSESLLPTSDHLLDGYRFVQEYYCFPEKFQFFDLLNLQCIKNRAVNDTVVANAKTIELRFEFNRPFESHVSISKHNFQLFCVPIVNLFPHDAVPVRVDHKKSEYRLIPSGDDYTHYEVYDITRVDGWNHQQKKSQQYERFESFKHTDTAFDSTQLRYFRERLKPSVSGFGSDSYMAFVDQNEEHLFPQEEIITIELTCTNRQLPTQLEIGDICLDTSSSPEYASFRNITQVTPSLAPPIDQGFYWRLISHMSLNYQSLTNLTALSNVLTTFDYKSFTDRQQALANQYRLTAFDGIHSRPSERLFAGLVVRGQKTIIRLKESHFSSDGDLYIFGSVLNELFALHSTINAFHQLEVHGVEKGEVYQWTARSGYHPLI